MTGFLDRADRAADRSTARTPPTKTSPMPFEYHARRPWSPQRPDILVVCCSDGRWHGHVGEFVGETISDHADMYAVPGGPAVLDPWGSSFDEARAMEGALRLLLRYHALDSIWLIAHEGCAYYRSKHPELDPAAIRARQHAGLRRGRAHLLERHPHLAVRSVFAGLAGDRVVFTTYEDDDVEVRTTPDDLVAEAGNLHMEDR